MCVSKYTMTPLKLYIIIPMKRQSVTLFATLLLSVWLAQLIKALAAPTYVHSCVQEVTVRSPEQTSSTLASIPPGYVK